MKINNLANVNFKSKVKVIDTLYRNPEKGFNDNYIGIIKRALKKLENNGNDDTVEVFLCPDDDNISLKVKQDKRKKRYEGIASIPLFYRTLNGKDITNAYNQAVIKASMSEPVQKSVFDEYI